MFDNYFFNLLKNKSVSCKILTLLQIFSLSLIQILELNFSIGIFKSYFKYKNFMSSNIKFYYPYYSEISQKLISMESLYLLSSRREFDPCFYLFQKDSDSYVTQIFRCQANRPCGIYNIGQKVWLKTRFLTDKGEDSRLVHTTFSPVSVNLRLKFWSASPDLFSNYFWSFLNK